MAIATLETNGRHASPATTTESIRPGKRRRIDGQHHRVPPHPLDVKPSGNAYAAEKNSKDASGLFAQLNDEVLMQILQCWDAVGLVTVGSTCKALYAFSRAEELWKELYFRSPPRKFEWLGSWRSSYLSISDSKCAATKAISCSSVFSDVLYRPFFCAHVILSNHTSSIRPEQHVPRLSRLSAEEFATDWTARPFILTDTATSWPALQDWTVEKLLERYGDVSFRAEAVDWPMKEYVRYMRNNSDESPLYLFDCQFVEKMGLEQHHAPSGSSTGTAFWPPECYGEDLFEVLGQQRPDRRWLIMGPVRSGSTFHTDPNGTSAWNAVLSGAKYWILFPPSVPNPPGVFVSASGAEITAPVSIGEYLLSFHHHAVQYPGCIQAVCRAGEIMHVPAGWLHMVVNLEEGVAVTQNFVPRARLPQVLRFLRDKPDQISGFANDVSDPWRLFVQRLQERRPDVLTDLDPDLLQRSAERRPRWRDIAESGHGNGNGNERGDGQNGGLGGTDSFTFGFCDDGDD